MTIAVPNGSPLDLERLECQLDLTYNWGYAETRKDLRDLYRKAKRSQWNSDDQLPWDTDVDIDKENMPEMFHPLYGSEIYGKLTKEQHVVMRRELTSWTLSQFL